MCTFVVKSSLNVTVFVIKNAPDNLQFLHVIRANNFVLPSGEYRRNIAVNFIHCDTPAVI